MKFTIKMPFKDGLHARPASELVKLCSGFSSTAVMTFEGKNGNMKSIIEMLSLGLAKGIVMEIEVTGEDEVEASSAIKEFLGRMKMSDALLGIKVDEKIVARKRREVYGRTIEMSPRINSGRIISISPSDLEIIFDLYDEIFFNNWFKNKCRNRIEFALSKRMTRKCRHGKVFHKQKNR